MFAYHTGPVDFGWEELRTVKETAERLGRGHPGTPEHHRETPPALSADEFQKHWEIAQQAADEAGWEGDFRHEPVVFWIPVEESFQPGFVIKQDNNGSTFTVSPVSLPWLEDQ